jgi:hypothetical protein
MIQDYGKNRGGNNNYMASNNNLLQLVVNPGELLTILFKVDFKKPQ